MKAKRLLTLLEGLCKAAPEANVTFKVVNPDLHAKVQLVDDLALDVLDIMNICSCFGTPGSNDEEENNFMDIVIDLAYADEYVDLIKESEEFDKLYKKVAE